MNYILNMMLVILPTLIFKFKTKKVIDAKKYLKLKLQLNYKAYEIM